MTPEEKKQRSDEMAKALDTPEGRSLLASTMLKQLRYSREIYCSTE